MEIGTRQNSVARLQQAISVAKTRTASVKTAYNKQAAPVAEKRVPKASGYSTAGSLFERLYGQAADKKVETKAVKGTKFDFYA